MRWWGLSLVGACHLALGDYEVGEAPAAECSSDADCDSAANEGCDAGRCAIRCLDDDPCPEFSECWAASFCTEPIGTACDPADTEACGGYLCRDRTVEATPTAGYCPGHCDASLPCPAGFTCNMLSCYRD